MGKLAITTILFLSQFSFAYDVNELSGSYRIDSCAGCVTSEAGLLGKIFRDLEGVQFTILVNSTMNSCNEQSAFEFNLRFRKGGREKYVPPIFYNNITAAGNGQYCDATLIFSSNEVTLKSSSGVYAKLKKVGPERFILEWSDNSHGANIQLRMKLRPYERLER